MAGSWWGEENIMAKLEEGQDCRVDRLVRKTFPPTFKRIMLLFPDIVSVPLLIETLKRNKETEKS